MKTEKYIKLGRLTAIISFLLGTIILVLYYLTSAFQFAFIGYGFVALAGFLNIALLIRFFIEVMTCKDFRKKLLMTCGLMLLNIPVAIFYCWFAIALTGVMRITFVNSTQATLVDINIVGCETEHIDRLEIGESETVWVGITGDCTINVDYLSNGQRKEENVAGYVTGGMGQKMKHNIGGKNNNIL